MPTTDAESLLVRHVRAGDARAWRQVIERFEGRLRAFVDSRISSPITSASRVVGPLTNLGRTTTAGRWMKFPETVARLQASRAAASGAKPRNSYSTTRWGISFANGCRGRTTTAFAALS